jgi:hypothetical protein
MIEGLKQKIHLRFEKFRKEYVIPHSLIVNDFEYDVLRLLDEVTTQIQESPFIRRDFEIEIEIKNARRNWKRCKKKGTNQVTDEDFKRILITKRIRLDEVLAVLEGEKKEVKG